MAVWFWQRLFKSSAIRMNRDRAFVFRWSEFTCQIHPIKEKMWAARVAHGLAWPAAQGVTLEPRVSLTIPLSFRSLMSFFLTLFNRQR